MKIKKATPVLAAIAFVLTLTILFTTCDTGSSNSSSGNNGNSSNGGSSTNDSGVSKKIIITGMDSTLYKRFDDTGVSLRVVPVGTAADYWTIVDCCEAVANINPVYNAGNSKIENGEIVFELVNDALPWTGSGNHYLYIWDYYFNQAGISFQAYRADSVNLSQTNTTVPFSAFTKVTVTRESPW